MGDNELTMQDLLTAFRSLEARVSALETGDDRLTRDSQKIADAPDAPFWALEGLKSRVGPHSAVLFTGIAALPGNRHYEWQEGVVLDRLFEDGWEGLGEALAALGHPVRLSLVYELLTGRTSTSEIKAQEGFATTGQVYHHLRQLVATGWVRATERGHYEIVPERVIPLLVILAAARKHR